MDMFSQLPEDVVSEILGRTSMTDMCTAVPFVSKALYHAAGSDLVWDKFFPSDCFLILERSVSPVLFDSKKELYRRLCCDSDVLIDSGKLCFSLELKYGGKIYMVSARELLISWGDDSMHWEWISCSNSSFPESAKLVNVCWLDIRGKINTQMLSTDTNYGAFLVFRLGKRAQGLDFVSAVVRLVNDEDDKDAEERADLCHLQRKTSFDRRRQTGRFATKREEFGVSSDEMNEDAWMELELGNFYNGEGDDGELEARMMEIEYLGSKSGLIVQGIEFRPI